VFKKETDEESIKPSTNQNGATEKSIMISEQTIAEMMRVIVGRLIDGFIAVCCSPNAKEYENIDASFAPGSFSKDTW